MILSLGALLPFFGALFKIIRMIPCPRLAAFVSNTALVGTFIGIILVGVLLFKDAWKTYVYMMCIWPWIAIATVVARLHIGRDRDVSHFSPFFHLPILGILGAGSWIAMVYAIKSMTITDAVVLGCVDSFFAAFLHTLLIRRVRYFENNGRELVLSVLVIMLYIYGVSYTGGVVKSYYDATRFATVAGAMSIETYAIFFAGRAAHIIRCSYIKKSFFPFKRDVKTNFKSLFPNFPFPIRFRLDVIFDSGIIEDMPHAIGPTGTRDLYALTDDLYLLPLAAIASWILENVHDGTLIHGLAPTITTASAPTTAIIYIALTLLVLSIGFTAYATSRILFDRGSSPNTWGPLPFIIQLPYVCIDLLYLNPFITRFQIVCLLILIGMQSELRNSLWLQFKKKYFVGSMDELQFLQPSCLRTAQKQILSEALEKSGVDDFGNLLLETAIHHGNNIKGYLRLDGTNIWDPKPSASAAWKLAGSLVIRAIRNRKKASREATETREGNENFMEDIVDVMVDNVRFRRGTIASFNIRK
jgi:hypothetical protein